MRRVGGVDAACQSARKDGGVVGDRPLGGVEADYADRVVPLEAEPGVNFNTILKYHENHQENCQTSPF